MKLSLRLMMKRALLIPAFLYLLFSSGLIINSHYCMNQLSSLELFGSADDTCNKCGMLSTHGCCNDETQLFKLQADHLTSNVHFTFRTFSTGLPTYVMPEILQQNVTPCDISYLFHPPPDDGVPIFKKNRVFRI